MAPCIHVSSVFACGQWSFRAPIRVTHGHLQRPQMPRMDTSGTHEGYSVTFPAPLNVTHWQIKRPSPLMSNAEPRGAEAGTHVHP